MNFGETLAYWYLRLNGFIPMRNFVLHHAGIEASQSADADLLAIRFPNVYELIGGKPVDWDSKKFADWQIDLNRRLAFIVEVKTGLVPIASPWCRRPRLQAAIMRLGILNSELAAEAAMQLEKLSNCEVGDWIVAKLLVSQEPHRGPWLNLTLSQANDFISIRIQKYKTEKGADRLRFPDDLMQYLAWFS